MVKVPTPGKGQRVWFLDIPYEHRGIATAHRAEWFPNLGWAYVGTSLPSGLANYRPRRYSWEEWLEEDYLGHHRPTDPAPAPDPSTGSFTPRRDQLEDVRSMLMARKAGSPEFLIGSEVGTGKTLVTIAGVKRMANVKNVLIMCPASARAGWRLHLKEMGDGGKNWCIINYESNKKLLTVPKSAQGANQRTRTKNLRIASQGTSRVDWDVVITDESHRISNPEAQQTRACERIIAGPNNRSAFVIRVSATAGSNPAELSYLHRMFAWRDGRQVKAITSSEEYAEWCQSKGIAVDLSGFGGKLKWTGTELDLKKMNRLIYGGEIPTGIRRVPDWPGWVRIPVPVELTTEERVAYDAEWSAFEAARAKAVKARLAGSMSPAKVKAARMQGMAALTRYRQKAGILRAPGSADFIADMVAKGKQVAVSCEYLGTVEALQEELIRRKVPVVTFTGANPNEREDNRVAYQRGQAKAIIFTVTESINLHAGEKGVGGNSAPRITYVAEPRWSPKKTLQIEGRGQRNGTQAPIFYAFAVDTVEEKVIFTVIEGMKNTAMINGADTAPFVGLAEAIGTPRDMINA